jgi:hypothetical protein
MTGHEHDQPSAGGGLYASAVAVTPERRSRRRKQAVVGVVGAAALLAGGAFLGLQLNRAERSALPEPASLAPPVETEEPAPSPSEQAPEPALTRTPGKATMPAEAVQLSPPPPPPSESLEAEASGAAQAAIAAAEPVEERTELLDNGTIRILSAQRDLTGERELSLAADQGRPVGQGIKCTTKVRVSTGAGSSSRPTTLLCWRTSESRSVVTMAVVPSGEPPMRSSVAIIGEEWARLG